MKILHVSVYPQKEKKHIDNVSGVAWYEKALLNNLINTDPTTKQIILCQRTKFQNEFYVEDNIEVYRCFDRNLFYWLNIIKQIYKIKPDLIHIQQELGMFGNKLTAFILPWMILILRFKFKVFTTLHGVVAFSKINKDFVTENNSNLQPWLVKIAFWLIYYPLCQFSTGLIVHEKYFKKILKSEYKINENKINVFSLGVEDLIQIPREEARQTLQIPLEAKVVLFMGYLTGYKGLDLLIEVAGKFAQIEPEALFIFGAGKHPALANDENYLKNEYFRLQSKAEQLIPKKNYVWIGFIPEEHMAKYYSSSNVCIFPYTIAMSSSGPMSISVSYQIPFIASDVFSEVINYPEILFERNSSSLMACLQNFFNNESKYTHWISETRNKLLWKNIASDYIKFYKSSL